jgi:single-strand DNA-binding protein
MSSMNKAIIIGNLGRDPEIRNLQNGDPIASLSVATSESWKGKDGEWKEQTEWHRVTVFNTNGVKHIEKYARKGNKVVVEGKIQTRKWQDQSGQDRFTTEIVVAKFGGRIAVLDAAEKKQSSGGYNNKPNTASQTKQKDSFFDDEIPF